MSKLSLAVSKPRATVRQTPHLAASTSEAELSHWRDGSYHDTAQHYVTFFVTHHAAYSWAIPTTSPFSPLIIFGADGESPIYELSLSIGQK